MSEQTLEAPPLRLPPDVPRRSRPSPAQTASGLLYRYRWILGAIGLLAISLPIVLWARTRPGYDPYGWLVWGRLTLHGDLNTNGAPSWKPLPYLFTVPYALAGHYAMWLWMVTAAAFALAGPIFAWRIAFRLTDAPPERRYASYAAGLFAALAVLGINEYTHYWLSSQSDPMIVSLCLAAIDCQLCRRPGWAFWCWVLAALGRPEAWAFLGLYSIWLWRSHPRFRGMIVAGIAVQPLLWFGIPALTSKSWFIAGDLAQNSPRALASNKFFGTIHRFLNLDPIPVEIAALLSIVVAFVRRDRGTQLIAGGTVLWVLIEGAFAVHGWPGVPRYLFEPAATTGVLAGIFVGRVILDVPPRVAAFARRLSPRPLTPGLAARLGSWGAIVVLAVLVGSLLPQMISRVRVERADLHHERARTVELNRLDAMVKQLGAKNILACGQPNMTIEYQSALAWYMGTDTGSLWVSASFMRDPTHPLVNMFPHSYGWQVFASHTVTAAERARCRNVVLNPAG